MHVARHRHGRVLDDHLMMRRNWRLMHFGQTLSKSAWFCRTNFSNFHYIIDIFMQASCGGHLEQGLQNTSYGYFPHVHKIFR